VPRDPGPLSPNPFSRLAPAKSSFITGCNDAGDPSVASHPSECRGPAGLNGPPGKADIRLQVIKEFLDGHRVLRSGLVQATLLDRNVVRIPEFPTTVWRVGDAVLYRSPKIGEDDDGSPRAYHPPTDDFWLGYDHNNRHRPGLGMDSLLNAVGKPKAKDHYDAHDKQKRKNYPLTSGCELLKDLNHARGLATATDPASVRKFHSILQEYGAVDLAALETKGLSAVCVEYVAGRDKQKSRDDWRHVETWKGIKTIEGTNTPIIRQSGQFAGYYIPSIIPTWADADVHPWLVLNPRIGTAAGVNLGNPAVVITNKDIPDFAYGMVADVGPKDGIGECSITMLRDLGIADSLPDGDYIFIMFPGESHTRRRTAEAMRADAKTRFESWAVNCRSGMALIKDLFLSLKTFHQMEIENGLRSPGDKIGPRNPNSIPS